MPAAGTTKISKQTKAMILAEKRVGTGTSREIADKYGVAVQTVRNLGLGDRPVSKEVLVLAARHQDRILSLSASNVELGLKAINERISDPKERLSALVQAVRLCYEIYRDSLAARDPIDERVEQLLNLIQVRATQTNVSFEAELENYLLHYSHHVMPEVRSRLEMIQAGHLANKEA